MSELAQPPRIAAMFGGDRVSFVLGGRFRSFLTSSEQGQRVIAELKKEVQDIDQIAELSDIALYVAKRSSGRVVVDDKDRLLLDRKVVDYGLAGRILAVIQQGFEFDALARFIEKVDENPDKAVAADLFRFLEKGNMPLTPEGNFLAFKKVDNEGWSYRAGVNGKVHYKVGDDVSEDRELCDSNRNRTCSTGLHVCSYEYLNVWYRAQGRVLICEVNPRDVTAVPTDHNDQKLRTCLLRVVAEIPEAEAKDHFKSAVDGRYPSAPPVPTVEQVEEALIDWRLAGLQAGAEAGKSDAETGYDFDDAIEGSEYRHMPEGARGAFEDSYARAYEAAYDVFKALDWCLTSVVIAGAYAGAEQARADHPIYDNAVEDAKVREEIVAFVEAQTPELIPPEDHELADAFDRAYRDAYHETFQGIGA